MLKKLLACAGFLLLAGSTHGKKEDLAQVAAEIMAEGKMLYRTDMASWYGTDILQERLARLRENIGGYFSYLDNDVAKCVFFSRKENHAVLATISFDTTYNLQKAVVDDEERPFSSKELELFTIREKAMALVNSDTMFKMYKGGNLNLIPVVYRGKKRVYIINGSERAEVVLLGNDYLIEFDNSNAVISKKKLHKNLIPVENKDGHEDIVTMHSHLPETGDFITATDVCTIMEYQQISKWKQHYVFSKAYVSIWDCRSNYLMILTMKAWEKIGKSQEKREAEK